MMRFTPLRAKTKTGGLFEFSLTDGPKPVSETEMVLSNVPNTPVILRLSVRIGSEVYNEDGVMIYDGDYLPQHDVVVKYCKGFKCYRDNRFLCNLRDLPVIGPAVPSEHIIPERKSCVYMSEFGVFTFTNICLCTKDAMVVRQDKLRRVTYSSVRQYSGLNSEDLYFCYGDYVINRDGVHGLLDLIEGVLVIVRPNNEIVTVETKDYNKLQLTMEVK